MKKYLFYPILIALLSATLFLAACGGNAQTTTPPLSASPTSPEVVLPTSAPNSSSSEPTSETAPEGESGSSPFEPVSGNLSMEGCTVSTLLPQADPTIVSRFSPVSEADWQRGPTDAAVTIVEYGDFQ